MKCNNCGKELNNNAKFCDECGSPVNSDKSSSKTQIFQSTTEPKTNEKNATNISSNSSNGISRKNKIITGVCSAAVLLLIIIIASPIGTTNYQPENTVPYTPTQEANDTFGNNETVTAIPVEEITQAPTNVEVVYSDIIHNSYNGGVKITDYTIQYTDGGKGLNIYFTFEKVANNNSKSYNSFAAEIYFYDASGNVLDSSQTLYVVSFNDDPIGKTYKYTSTYHGDLISNISAQRIAKIEIWEK